jgi:hypothetical protein
MSESTSVTLKRVPYPYFDSPFDSIDVRNKGLKYKTSWIGHV